MRYEIDQHTVEIRSFPSKMVTRAYDVSDIIGPMVEQWKISGIQEGGPTGAIIFRGAPTTIFSGGPTPAAPARGPVVLGERDAIEEVRRWIMIFIGEDDWYDMASGEADIKSFGGMLIVRQTEENHRAILRLLALIRQVGKSGPTQLGVAAAK